MKTILTARHVSFANCLQQPGLTFDISGALQFFLKN
jgi:hypothetical protein